MARDYVTHVKSLFPRGATWNFAAPVFGQLAEAIAIEFARIDARAVDLLAEMDPRTTTELIADWERVCGLPDPCAAAPTTLADRRAAVTARLLARGTPGPNATFLRSLIVALGYDEDDVTIRRFHLEAFTCESECDDALNTDTAGWPFVWEFVAKSGTLDEVLMCQVSRSALSDLLLTFAFPLVRFDEGTFVRSGTAVFYDPTDGGQSDLAEDELGTAYYGV